LRKKKVTIWAPAAAVNNCDIDWDAWWPYIADQHQKLEEPCKNTAPKNTER
jgi:hypothetical protein